MAIGTGFGQVFKGIGKDFLKKAPPNFRTHFLKYHQVKSAESLFHQPFSSQT